MGRRATKDSLSFTYDRKGRLISQSNGLQFSYDHTGIFGFKIGYDRYFYRKDAQGNIIALIDINGTILARYIYDAWGNHKVVDNNGVEITDSTHVGNLNPFRYRGYYFDTETGLYFLKTRYYDPQVGRFITIDSIEYIDPETINGLNLYAYCGNNPVMNIDPDGHAIISFLIGLAVTRMINDAVSTIFAQKQIYAVVDIASSLTNVYQAYNLANSKYVGGIENITHSTQFGATNFGQTIDGGPWIDVNAKGYGEDGQFTPFQKVMGVIASIGGVGMLAGAALSVSGASVIGVPLFAISAVVVILSAILGGFGGAT